MTTMDTITPIATPIPAFIIADVNRYALAKATKLDKGHISRIFNGKARPSLESAVKIAQHLNITVEQLYAELGKIKRPRDDR